MSSASDSESPRATAKALAAGAGTACLLFAWVGLDPFGRGGDPAGATTVPDWSERARAVEARAFPLETRVSRPRGAVRVVGAGPHHRLIVLRSKGGASHRLERHPDFAGRDPEGRPFAEFYGIEEGHLSCLAHDGERSAGPVHLDVRAGRLAAWEPSTWSPARFDRIELLCDGDPWPGPAHLWITAERGQLLERWTDSPIRLPRLLGEPREVRVEPIAPPNRADVRCGGLFEVSADGVLLLSMPERSAELVARPLGSDVAEGEVTALRVQRFGAGWRRSFDARIGLSAGPDGRPRSVGRIPSLDGPVRFESAPADGRWFGLGCDGELEVRLWRPVPASAEEVSWSDEPSPAGWPAVDGWSLARFEQAAHALESWTEAVERGETSPVFCGPLVAWRPVPGGWVATPGLVRPLGAEGRSGPDVEWLELPASGADPGAPAVADDWSGHRVELLVRPSEGTGHAPRAVVRGLDRVQVAGRAAGLPRGRREWIGYGEEPIFASQPADAPAAAERWELEWARVEADLGWDLAALGFDQLDLLALPSGRRVVLGQDGPAALEVELDGWVEVRGAAGGLELFGLLERPPADEGDREGWATVEVASGRGPFRHGLQGERARLEWMGGHARTLRTRVRTPGPVAVFRQPFDEEEGRPFRSGFAAARLRVEAGDWIEVSDG